ncbi:MAG: hypothetical protein Q9168_005600 [Polycauliona sp. 1 TL-2023]
MESPLPPDPYKALDVPKDASLATIRSAHRKLVLKTHPDKVQGDEVLKKKRAEEFHTIQQSYEILSDDSKRKAYDDRVRLAALRAEIMAERPGARIASDIRPMSGRSPVVEVRGGRVYEERVPRTTSWDDHGDDFFSHKAPDTRPKYEDMYTPSTARKSSARQQEEKMRARDIEEEQERLRWERSYAKEQKKSVFAERDRRRTTTRKKDYDSKYDTRHRGPYVEDDSDTSSGSSDTHFTYQSKRREEPPRHRYEEMRRKDREDTPRRDSKRAVEDLYPPSHEVKAFDAAAYIRKSREPEPESRRPAMYKGASTREIRPTPPPVSAPDNPRRSSGRPPLRREPSPPPKLSAKNRRMTEIVDPPEPRRMPASSSDPKGLRGMVREKPVRSSTAADRYAEPKLPRIARAETMPIHRSRHDDQPYTKASRSKELDSGYSSPESPPATSPKKTSTKIFVVEEDEEGAPRSYSTAYLTPEDKYRRDRERDISPPLRKSADRPSMSSRAGTSSRMPSGRTPSYAVIDTDEARPPRLKRSETDRPPPLSSRPSANNSPRQYFGEVTEEPYKIVHQSPKPGPHDIRYARYDPRASEDASADWAPGSNFDPRSRPSNHRSNTSRVH